MTADAVVVEVSRRHGQAVATVAYAPPAGVTRAFDSSGARLPTVEPAYLGGLAVSRGEIVSVSLPLSGSPPMIGVAEAFAATESLRARMRFLYAAAAIGYLLGILTLVAVVRRSEGPAIRAEVASRHGGA